MERYGIQKRHHGVRRKRNRTRFILLCARVDAETGEEVPSEDIMKGFKVDTDTCVEVTKEELENVARESTRTIDIDEFVQRDEIDPRYIIRPYYLRRHPRNERVRQLAGWAAP
jgi:non-homologous end joining protein Ku